MAEYMTIKDLANVMLPKKINKKKTGNIIEEDFEEDIQNYGGVIFDNVFQMLSTSTNSIKITNPVDFLSAISLTLDDNLANKKTNITGHIKGLLISGELKDDDIELIPIEIYKNTEIKNGVQFNIYSFFRKNGLLYIYMLQR